MFRVETDPVRSFRPGLAPTFRVHSSNIRPTLDCLTGWWKDLSAKVNVMLKGCRPTLLPRLYTRFYGNGASPRGSAQLGRKVLTRL